MMDFDDIRPYRDEEIPAAMQRIATSDAFPLLASWIFPEQLDPEKRYLFVGNHRDIMLDASLLQ